MSPMSFQCVPSGLCKNVNAMFVDEALAIKNNEKYSLSYIINELC
jgi:hypothetical protein